MKKSTLKSLVSYLNGETITNLDEIRDELARELAKGEEKANANRELYAQAHDIIFAHMGAEPQTAAALYEACANELPEGFSRSKITYAMTNYWANEVETIDNGRSAKSYKAKG